MENAFIIKCPKCGIEVLVDRITGEVIETREPLVSESTGDRFSDALKKVKSSPREAEEKFEKSKAAEKNKSKELDALFKKSLEQAKKEGPIGKQMRDIDFE
ncbi:hypothetical protein JW933_03080 [candidate division FCPU426 bacterium]|nr:hypothetical protein [candidate division FCPU426 bacterium]